MKKLNKLLISTTHNKNISISEQEKGRRKKILNYNRNHMTPSLPPSSELIGTTGGSLADDSSR